jgi:hypothetical protein
MSKHKPEVAKAEDVFNRFYTQIDDCFVATYGWLTNDDRDFLAAGKWCMIDWPEHCITKRHISDATIHGPYDTEAEAAEGFC